LDKDVICDLDDGIVFLNVVDCCGNEHVEPPVVSNFDVVVVVVGSGGICTAGNLKFF
jgi:hypothetical protein